VRRARGAARPRGVLDTSLPNQLSTGPRFLVHPNRQRSDNGATGCVNHPVMAQPSFAKQRLPPPFLFLGVRIKTTVRERIENSFRNLPNSEVRDQATTPLNSHRYLSFALSFDPERCTKSWMNNKLRLTFFDWMKQMPQVISDLVGIFIFIRSASSGSQKSIPKE
jgi:hypothetical protein